MNNAYINEDGVGFNAMHLTWAMRTDGVGKSRTIYMDIFSSTGAKVGWLSFTDNEGTELLAALGKLYPVLGSVKGSKT